MTKKSTKNKKNTRILQSSEDFKDVPIALCLFNITDNHIITSLTCPESLPDYKRKEIILDLYFFRPPAAKRFDKENDNITISIKEDEETKRKYIRETNGGLCNVYKNLNTKCTTDMNTTLDSEGNLLTYDEEAITYINHDEQNSYIRNKVTNLVDNSQNINKIEIETYNNSLNKSPLLAKKKFDLNQSMKLFENYNIKSIGMMKENNLILVIMNLFKITIRKIYTILQNVLYNICVLIDQKQEEQPKDEETVPDIKFSIIPINSEIVEETMNSEIKNIREKLRVKKQIYSRNKDQLLSHHTNQNNSLNKKVRHSFSSDNIFKEDEKNLFIKKYQIISHEDLFNEFSNYNQKNPFVAKDEFIGINKKLFLEEYTNELVAENDIEKIRNEKMKKVKEASKKINAKLEEKELKHFLNKKANKQKIIKLRKKVANTRMDEQGEEELKEYEKELMLLKNELKESKKPKRFKMKLANPENNLINNRKEDIRLLEINYIKNYSDYRLEQNIFNEYFYNVRKKFNDINKKQINSHELNNSLSTRNLSKKRKNFSIILPKIENKPV